MIEEMKKISLVIPCYNEQESLPLFDAEMDKVIKSMSEYSFEIIYVNDGSKDNSLRICQEIARADDRVRVFDQANCGVSKTRNRGLQEARGEYIAFVDSDDWIDADMYKRMVDTAKENNCDLVICDCLKESDSGSHLYTHGLPAGFYDRKRMYSVYFPQLLMPNTMEYPVTISNWHLLIRREVITANQITFPEGMRFSEDLLFGSEVGHFAQSMTYLKEYAPYHYRQNPDSVTHTAYKDKWPLLRELWCRINESFSKKQDYDFTQQIQRCMLFFVYMAMNQRRYAGLPTREFFHEAGVVLDDPLVHESLRTIQVGQLQISWKLKIISLIYQKKGLRPALLLLRG